MNRYYDAMEHCAPGEGLRERLEENVLSARPERAKTYRPRRKKTALVLLAAVLLLATSAATIWDPLFVRRFGPNAALSALGGAVFQEVNVTSVCDDVSLTVTQALCSDKTIHYILEYHLPEGFSLEEGDIHALMASVKASIPALIEHMKDTRPEDVVSREILEELKIAPEDGGEALSRQYELTDGQWEQLRDLFPPEKAGKGRAFKSNRLMLDGILYWMKSGANWKDLPERFGRHKCVSDRLRLWVRTGVWQPVLRELLALHILEEDDVPASLREEAGENPSQK